MRQSGVFFYPHVPVHYLRTLVSTITLVVMTFALNASGIAAPAAGSNAVQAIQCPLKAIKAAVTLAAVAAVAELRVLKAMCPGEV